MYDDRIYYEDQADWTAIDRQGLWRYLNRLFLSLGPSDVAKPEPDSLSARIQARRTGKRDDEIAALDLSPCRGLHVPRDPASTRLGI
ncbi:hypothetical protein [Microbacterium sp. K35]|uniref:hypothetical protein n=1 Tax=Microbacterium sp. K35 TaxID=2305440 RepID=UPI00109BACF0|nr:hypothetical protein [Microbacterium sp. K35]